MKIRSLSIFFPCLNDERSIPRLLAKTYRILPKITSNYEVIIIDDGSTDNAFKILQSLEKKYKNLRIIRGSKPSGYGGALKKGFAASQKEWVFYTDGDGQYDPAELKNLVEKAGPKIDVVNGYKKERNDHFMRKFLGSSYNLALHLLYSVPIRDIDCDFRLIRASYLKKIKLRSNSGAICLELVMKLKKSGAQFCEVPVSHFERRHGKSAFFKIPNLIKTFTENLKLYKELSY